MSLLEKAFGKVIMPSLSETYAITKGSPLEDTQAKTPPKSMMWDPMSLVYSLGYKDRRSNVTYDTLKLISNQLGVIAAIINTRVNQVATFTAPYRRTRNIGFEIKHKDKDHKLTDSEKEFILEMELFISNCGRAKKNKYTARKRDDFEHFTRKVIRDRMIFDQLCFEVVPDRKGMPFEFVAIDASTVRIAAAIDEKAMKYFDKFKSPGEKKFLGEYGSAGITSYPKVTNGKLGNSAYCQVWNGSIVRAYNEDELAFCISNPRTDIRVNGYGLSELEQLVNIITSHLWAEEYNRNFFKQGAAPKGLLNIRGDNIAPEQLESFRREWTANVSGVENCISGDTLLFTKEFGGSKVYEIVGDSDEVSCTVWTGESWKSGLVYKTKENKQLCITKLSNGVGVKSSPDHKFRVIGESGDLEWRAQSDLQYGDYVCVNKKSPQTEFVKTCNGVPITPDFMEVLGWFICDGYLASEYKRKQSVWFYNCDTEREIRTKHLSVLQRYCPEAYLKDITLSKDEIDKVKERYGFKSVAPVRLRICADYAYFVDSLVSDLEFQSSKDGKCVPSWVFTAPDEYKQAFLRGVFSADGHNAKGRTPGITISNHNLRSQVRLLLLSLGIRTSFYEGNKKLVISGKDRSSVDSKSLFYIKDRDSFFNQVGFLQEHKQPTVLSKKNEANKYSRVAPQTIIKYARYARDAARGRDVISVVNGNPVKINNRDSEELTKGDFDQLGSIICGHDGCSLPRLLRFLEKTGVTPPTWLTEYHFEHVVELETTDQFVPMFDVSIDDDVHAFSGNGAILHNSWRTPILQSEEIQYINMQGSNLDMEFNRWLEYLTKVICACFLIAPEEIGFYLSPGGMQQPMFDSNNEWKLKASKDRGLRPLLRFYASSLNKKVIDHIDDHFYLDFVGLDELTERERIELHQSQVQFFRTINEVRKDEDLPPLPDGDIVMNPVYLQKLQMEHAWKVEAQTLKDQKKSQNDQMKMQKEQHKAQMVAQKQQMASQKKQEKQQEKQVKQQEEAQKQQMEMQKQQVAMQQQQLGGAPQEGAPTEQGQPQQPSPEELAAVAKEVGSTPQEIEAASKDMGVSAEDTKVVEEAAGEGVEPQEGAPAEQEPAQEGASEENVEEQVSPKELQELINSLPPESFRRNVRPVEKSISYTEESDDE